ncbi:hypothetical protein Vadar_003459 [Vaccinium darrowii]|uniref:Uncharacterized protein n=1 Tax=Vaccinium darrowii TaxID=229202 RepID=A0ACB7YSG6_9ERIC|nr:hypothetical protein Vadar_003459 [Vaccinium darrowii]
MILPSSFDQHRYIEGDSIWVSIGATRPRRCGAILSVRTVSGRSSVTTLSCFGTLRLARSPVVVIPMMTCFKMMPMAPPPPNNRISGLSLSP